MNAKTCTKKRSVVLTWNGGDVLLVSLSFIYKFTKDFRLKEIIFIVKEISKSTFSLHFSFFNTSQ